MKIMKRALSMVLAAFIVVSLFAPMETQAASISGGVHFYSWGNDFETIALFSMKTQGITKFQYRVYNNSGSLRKQGNSEVYTSSSAAGRQICKVEGLPPRSCSYVSIRAYKNNAWTSWSSRTPLVPLFRASWLKMSGNKNTQRETISWKKITGAAQYEVYLSTSNKGGWVKTATTKGSSVTLSKFKGAKFKSGKTYYFKVLAKKKVNGKWVYPKGNTAKVYNGWFYFIY